jgi:hypothetical protein
MLPKVLTPLFVIIFSLSVFTQTPAPQSTPASPITPEMQKTIDQNTPAALPQTPAAKRDRSDAQDDNIKGKVKTVLIESETVGRPGSRQIDSIEDFNEHGNRLKHIAVDSRGNPWEIAVYGYIDGARVSRSLYITYSYDPPPPPAPLRPRNAPPDPPRDHRYELKYEYKYKNGKMTEENYYANSGKQTTHIVYDWKSDASYEMLVYTSDGKLNQKFVRTLDKAGNEVEELNPDLIPGKPYGDNRSVTRYDAFDSAGNWTKKTVTFYKVLTNGTEPIPTTYITYRTITYYK